MKKVNVFLSALLLIGLFGIPSVLHAWDVPANVMTSWGTPSVTRGGWEKTAITNVFLKEKKYPANAPDEEIAIVYMARQVVEKGGYFCATQIRSRNKGGSKVGSVWTQYQEIVGDANCIWLCEPGYSGDNCGQDSGSATCNRTEITKSSLSVAGYREAPGTGWDDYSIEASMRKQAYLGAGVGGKKDESDNIVVARTWLANKHGITASPVTFAASCRGGCGSGNSGLVLVANGGLTKTLCMPGWGGPGCSASSTECKTCQSGATWDNAAQKCVCNKNTLDQGITCLECEEGQYLSTSQGMCMTCSKYQYWNDKTGTCVDKTKYSTSIMGAEACQKDFDAVDYRRCLDQVRNPGFTIGTVTGTATGTIPADYLRNQKAVSIGSVSEGVKDYIRL